MPKSKQAKDKQILMVKIDFKLKQGKKKSQNINMFIESIIY